MCVLSSCVFENMDFKRVIPCHGNKSSLRLLHAYFFSMLSMYVDSERPSNIIDLSL